MNFQEAQKWLNEADITPEQEQTAQAFLSQAERQRWRGPDFVLPASNGLEIAWHGPYKADDKTRTRKSDDFVTIVVLASGDWYVRQGTHTFEAPKKGESDDAMRLIEAMVEASSR